LPSGEEHGVTAALKLLCDAGRYTIAQDEAMSAICGISNAAARLGAVGEILPLKHVVLRISATLGGFVRV